MLSARTRAKPFLGEFGLDATSKANRAAGDTVVSVWGLISTSSESETPENVMPLPYRSSGTNDESVIGSVDSRKLVAKEHFAPGGKYRSIVKLFLRFQNAVNPGSWAMATGWLIAPDLLVTAGHCAFDWGYNQGKLVEIKAYIGYHGKTNVNDPNVQFRKGKRVTTTPGWLRSGNRREGDIALIKVDPPFENITPIGYAATPATGLAKLGVVGYPGDLRDSKTEEAGANMYEAYEPTSWSLAKNQYRMLEYQVDTYGGNSGSPVFREGDTTSIGVHTYGGLVNSATVLGEFGNLLDPYIKAINSPPPSEFGDDVTEMSFATVAKAIGTENQFDGEASDAEGFLGKFFKVAWKLATEGGDASGPDDSVEFGGCGRLIGPMASIALQAGAATQDGPGRINRAAIIHRAVLGEAALTAVLKMSPETMQEFGIVDKMTKIVKANAPDVSRGWRRYGRWSWGPIIRTLAKRPMQSEAGLADPEFTSELSTLLAEDHSTEAQDPEAWGEADPGYRSLIEGIVGAAGADGQPIQKPEFWGPIASLVVGPVIKKLGSWAWKKFNETGPDTDGGAEAPSEIPALDSAPLRALAGDAALQVLATVPRPILAKEKAFESIWGILKTNLPTILRVGGVIAKAVFESSSSSSSSKGGEPIKILPFPPPAGSGEKPSGGAAAPSEWKFSSGFPNSGGRGDPLKPPPSVPKFEEMEGFRARNGGYSYENGVLN